jgi:hypothetical protein
MTKTPLSEEAGFYVLAQFYYSSAFLVLDRNVEIPNAILNEPYH